MRVLTRDLDEGLSLLSDVLRNPTFPAEEMEKTKRRIVGGLRRQRERPGHLANKAPQEEPFRGKRPMAAWSRERRRRSKNYAGRTSSASIGNGTA